MTTKPTPLPSIETRPRLGARSRSLADGLALAGALVVFGLLVAQMAPFVPDDSFISYRYAEHLAEGHGLRFNLDEPPLEGYSNFLWIALLALGARLGLGLETAGTGLGVVFGALNVVLLWWLLRRRGHSGAHLVVPVGLLAAAAPLILYAVSGMETVLFAGLFLALLLALDALLARPTIGRGLALAAAGVLLALARPEGVLAWPVVALGALLFNRQAEAAQRGMLARALLAGGLLFAAALAVYHAARFTYFDAFWPTPFLSKGIIDRSIVDAWIANLRQFFLRQSNYYAPMVYYYLALALPALAGVALSRRGGRAVEWTALALAVVFAGFYANFVDWMPGMRYYAPLIGLLLLPLALLGPALRNDADDRRADVAYLMLGATLGILSLFSLAVLRLDSQQLQAATQSSQVALGRWLRESVPPDSTLAMSDVGATPYYSRLRTIDINPESLTDRHIAANGWSSDYFFAADPDVVVFTAFSLVEPDFYGQHEALYAMPRFQATYEQVGVVRNDWYQDRAYWVFARRGLLPPAGQLAPLPPGISKR
jgi:hypothetical protein